MALVYSAVAGSLGLVTFEAAGAHSRVYTKGMDDVHRGSMPGLAC